MDDRRDRQEESSADVSLLPPAIEAMGVPGRPEELVFQVGRPLTVSHRFTKTARLAGVKAHLHDLRHTCLTWLVSHGVPLKLVQDIAGHSSINTTMLYAKVYSGSAYDAVFKAFGF